MRRSNRFAASDAARRKRRRVDRPMEGTVEASTRQTKAGPEVFADDALTVFSAALGNALQKLLGRPVVAEDRIFHFDPERHRASLELPSLRPPQQLSCAVEMEEDVQFSELTNSEQVTLRQSVEHKISKLMLKELESEGFLTFDTSQPPLHAWVPGKDSQRVALIPRAQRCVRIVPPRVTKASTTGVKTGEPVFIRLRKLQDSFAANPPEEYKEQIIFRPSAPSEPWYATVLLKGSDGERLEGAAMGQSAQAAREAAVRVLLDKLPRSLLSSETWTTPRQPESKMPRFARPWTRPVVPARNGGDVPAANDAPTGRSEARTPPPPPKPKRMRPRMVS